MAAKRKAKRKAKARTARITVVNLKAMAKSPEKFKALLKNAQKRRIGIGILNAPFKLHKAEAVS